MQSLLLILAGKIIAIVIGLCFFKFLSKPYRLILVQVIFALLCEWGAQFIVKHYHRNNIWVFNIYLLVEVWLIGLAGRLLLRNKLIQKFVLPVLILATLIWCSNIYFSGMADFANWCFVASSLILIVLYFIVLFDNALFSSQKIITQPVFWLSFSIIIFFGCDLPYFGIRNYLVNKHSDIELKVDYINYILNFIRYPLVAISFILCTYKQADQNKTITSSNVFR